MDKATARTRRVADDHGKEVTRGKPILEGEMPLNGSRFAGQLPPTIPFPTFAIRKKAIAILGADTRPVSCIGRTNPSSLKASAGPA